MAHYVKPISTGLVALAAIMFAGASPSLALTAQECSAKYNAAKTAGTLGGMKWNDFRKAQCGDGAAPAADTKADAAKSGEAAKPAAKAATGAATGGAVFPKAVDAKYAKESAGKARMHTCRDQYQANKANNGNGNLKWIMKGGGYYSECNKLLKG